MSDMSVSERRPERCPCGHVYGAGEYLVGWLPCGCTVGHTGHRTFWCQHCGHVLEIPPCIRIDIGTSEVLGIARPNWQFHTDPEPVMNGPKLAARRGLDPGAGVRSGLVVDAEQQTIRAGGG